MNEEWVRKQREGMLNASQQEKLGIAPVTTRTLANEMIANADGVANRTEAIAERLAQRLYCILKATPPVNPGDEACDRMVLPPLFEEMAGKLRRIDCALGMIEDIINRCGV